MPQFLNPQMIWLLAFIAIPIIIHFFNFRKRKRVLFSNLWFLKSVRNKTRSYSNLRRLLVLSLRVLFITWAVIALLQPFWPKENEETLPDSIYIDNSLSMSGLNGKNISLFEAAKEYASSRSEDRKVTILTNDEKRAGFFQNIDQTLDVSSNENNFQRVFDQIRYSNQHIIWLSDFQKNGESFLESILNDTLSTHRLVQLQSGLTSNLFVDSVFLARPIGYGDGNELSIVIRNQGSEDKSNQLIRVTQNDRQISSLSFDIAGGQSENIRVAMSANETIEGYYKVELIDQSFEFDNTYYFFISAPKRVRVLIVSDQEQNGFVTAAFGNNLIFNLNQRKVGEVAPEDMQDANLVVLDHLLDIPDWIGAELEKTNTTSLVIPNRIVDQDSYSRFFGSRFTANSDSNKYAISAKSLEHPHFAGLFDRSRNTDMPQAESRYKLNTPGESILLLDNGATLLKKTFSGKYVLLTALDSKFTNLAMHSLFIPTLYSIALGTVKEDNLSYRMSDELITFPIHTLALPNETLSIRGENSEYIVTPRFKSNRMVLEMPPESLNAGFYQLVNNTGDTLQTLAINYAKSESSMDFYTTDELGQYFQGSDHISVSSIGVNVGLDQIESRESESFPVWKYALILSLIFLVGEMFVLRFVK